MREELDDKLCKAFPLLYAERQLSMDKTAMCWGFECGDGWFDILWEASSKLEPLIKKWVEENPDEEYHPCASQIKEKYGTLRFYMNFATEEMYEITEKAETESETACEECGSIGKTEGPGWYRTLCEGCKK